MDKPELRHRFCSLRECIPAEDVIAASAALCHRLAAWLPTQLANQPTNQLTTSPPTILTYLAFRNEPNLGLLFDLLPDTQWAVPRIEKDQRLAIHAYDPTRLVRHRFGMLEPAADLPQVAPTSLDVVLVPGVAFDARGGRLGFGGGYYDRFLPTTPALRIGVALDQCLTDGLPCGEHDQRMDWVVTPTTSIHTAPFWRDKCRIP
jgi:5-formyltetrahydrofolate cyclo-ligase